MLSSTKYPIKICCVVDHHSDVDTEVEIVNEYTCNLGLTFTVREYNTWKYSDDRDMISSLPAFHIYFGEGYIDTFYPGDKVLNNIDACVQKYEKMQSDKRKFVEAWKNIFKIFWKNKLT